jgi:hypothetical protein
MARVSKRLFGALAMAFEEGGEFSAKKARDRVKGLKKCDEANGE